MPPISHSSIPCFKIIDVQNEVKLSGDMGESQCFTARSYNFIHTISLILFGIKSAQSWPKWTNSLLQRMHICSTFGQVASKVCGDFIKS